MREGLLPPGPVAITVRDLLHRLTVVSAVFAVRPAKRQDGVHLDVFRDAEDLLHVRVADHDERPRLAVATVRRRLRYCDYIFDRRVVHGPRRVEAADRTL